MKPGIYLLHKPCGPTSFSVLQEFTKGIPGKPVKTCHGGALDPFASGLLIVLVDPATKLFNYIHDVPKVYEATIRWGVETDNLDPGGKVVSTGDASVVTPEKLTEVLTTFVGWKEQVPPSFSNKRVDGERAYIKAHRGEEVVLPPSEVYLHEASWVSHNLPTESVVRLTARGGYYVRSLARDLGRAMGCGAHLGALKRVAIGPWSDPGEGGQICIYGKNVLPWAPIKHLTDKEVGELKQLRPVESTGIEPGHWQLPEGFPEPSWPLIRGFHRDRFCFVLAHDPDDLGQNPGLRVVAPLRGGL
jgi:tRNA pseudouridine55 synthase